MGTGKYLRKQLLLKLIALNLFSNKNGQNKKSVIWISAAEGRRNKLLFFYVIIVWAVFVLRSSLRRATVIIIMESSVQLFDFVQNRTRNGSNIGAHIRVRVRLGQTKDSR